MYTCMSYLVHVLELVSLGFSGANAEILGKPTLEYVVSIA